MSQIPTSMETYSVTKTPKPHLRHSNYFITLSTQKRLDKDSENYLEIEDKYRQGINEIFNSNNLLQKYITFKDSKAEYNNFFIKEVKVINRIEIDPTSNILHSHHAILIAHRSLIMLNTSLLKSNLKTLINSIFNNNKIFKFYNI